MSTSPYSIDLRKKVLDYLAKGKTQKEASEVFGVHRNTVSRWNVRYTQEGFVAFINEGLLGMEKLRFQAL